MTTRLDAVTAGRLLATGVVIGGIVLSILDARSVEAYGLPHHFQLRYFFSESLSYLWYGGTLLALTELARAFVPAEASGRFDWNITGLVRAIGLLVIFGGLALIVWEGRSFPTNFLLRTNSSFAFGSKRRAAHFALDYAFRGALLILVAELADRLGWRREAVEDEPADEPARTLASPLEV